MRSVCVEPKNTSISERLLNFLVETTSFFNPEDFVLVGTASNYFDKSAKELFGEIYDRDIDISVTKEYLNKHPYLEDKLYAEGFVKGAITEEITENRKRVLPDSYVLMKYDKGKKAIDILMGFHVSSPYFYKPIASKRDIRKISERRSFNKMKLNVLDFEHQIAEKLMLPEEKRAISFHKLFQLGLIMEYEPKQLGKDIAEILREYSRSKNSIEKWYETFKRYNYSFGTKYVKRAKQIFFKSLKRNLNL